MRVRRAKPYVCVDCDFADHFRFQKTRDPEVAAGAWLRCLAHSRAQEQDGVVTAAWLRRTFATTFDRIEELVAVGLLRARPDGDYEIHAYAPRNQTRAMLQEDRQHARARMASYRRERRKNADPVAGGAQAEMFSDTVGSVTANERRTNAFVRSRDTHNGALVTSNTTRSATSSRASATPSDDERGIGGAALAASDSADKVNQDEDLAGPPSGEAVRPNPRRTSADVTANKRRTNAFVPTSTSTSLSLSSSVSSSSLPEVTGSDRARGEVQEGGRAGGALPPSERAVSGDFWLRAFTDGVRDHTGRPCTAGRVYLGTLERLVAHHAPKRDAASACAWLRAEARAFAAQWDGKHPAKGLTPDGLERWLNDGRQGPPEFGRPRIVQPAAEDWHEDDWSDLGAEVLR